MASNFIPPYLRDKLGMFKEYGIPKCLPCLVVTSLECAVIAGLLWCLFKLISWKPVVGFIIIATICFFIILGWSLISWKKQKDKTDDYIKENG